MTQVFARFAKDEEGATAIEYGLIAALLSITIVGILGTTGDNLTDVFTTISTTLSGASTTP